jgi:hypothetical protein
MMEISEGEGTEGRTYNTAATRTSEIGVGSEYSDRNVQTLVHGFEPPLDYPKVPANLGEESGTELRNSIMKTRCAADPELAKKVIAAMPQQVQGWCSVVLAKGNKGDRHEGYVQVSFQSILKSYHATMLIVTFP